MKYSPHTSDDPDCFGQERVSVDLTVRQWIQLTNLLEGDSISCAILVAQAAMSGEEDEDARKRIQDNKKIRQEIRDARNNWLDAHRKQAEEDVSYHPGEKNGIPEDVHLN